jgi:hypothetical protein
MSDALRLGVLIGCVLPLVSSPAARAVDPEDIKQAVEKGVRHLRSVQSQDGHWNYNSDGSDGPTALAALTLLECGVPASDPAIQKAAAHIRQAATRLSRTYGISLAILFLDRLGDSEDVPLIQLLGMRLVQGQREGGWSYDCPLVGGEELVRELRNRRKPGSDGGKEPPRPEPPKKVQLPNPNPNPNAGPVPGGGIGRGIGVALPNISPTGPGDNSNTQFGTLGLWTARRHSIDETDRLAMDKSLVQIENRFRATQNADGGWGYIANVGGGGFIGGSSPQMTCAGLLGIAVGFGATNSRAEKASRDSAIYDRDGKEIKTGKEQRHGGRDFSKDVVVERALLYLGSQIGVPTGQRIQPGQGAQYSGLGRSFYLLWSLERVGVAYGLPTICKKDWYAWGAEVLLTTQHADGSWQGDYGAGGVDTAFALLFLRRANLALDLTSSLRGKVSDPGEVRLRSGGLAGKGLPGSRPAIDLKDKKGAMAKGPDFGRQPLEPPSASGKSSPAAKGEDPTKLAAQLAAESSGDKRQAMLEKLREGKGTEYTQALAGVIPKLTGQIKTRAREALAERLARMTTVTLRDKLQEQDLEIRRAAALACAMKDEKQLVPDLIALLKDPEPPVALAAQAALKDLSGQNFGPEKDASRAERDEAISRWKSWWAKQSGKGGVQ